MKILTLFARHGTEKYTDVDKRIKEQLATDLPDVEREFVVIDTALGQGHIEKKDNGVLLLGSSNEHWEFGAWMEAVHFFEKKLFSYDYIHLVTSAFYSGYIDFHRFISLEMLELFKGRAVALGHIEAYSEPVVYAGVRFQSWLRSSYIFLPTFEIKMLKDIVSVHNKADLFSVNPQCPFAAGGLMSENYKQNILSWLTRVEGTGQGVTWHSRFDLNDSNFDFFKAKAVAIINEMALSCRLKQQGCSLVDLTWLHNRMLASCLPTVIPSWHDQLIQRGTGHEFLVKGAD